jgi:hypothetical protein
MLSSWERAKRSLPAFSFVFNLIFLLAFAAAIPEIVINL